MENVKAWQVDIKLQLQLIWSKINDNAAFGATFSITQKKILWTILGKK